MLMVVFLYCGCFTQGLVEYYKQHSLKEGFSSLDTTLQVPYRDLSNGNMPRAITKGGSGESSQTSKFTCLTGVKAISSDQIFLRPVWRTRGTGFCSSGLVQLKQGERGGVVFLT